MVKPSSQADKSNAAGPRTQSAATVSPLKKKLYMIRKIAWAVVLGATIVVAWQFYKKPTTPTADEYAKSIVKAEFDLVDHTGRQVSGKDFRGNWLLVFFGFTNCPDICPTALSNMARVMEILGTDQKHVVPIFISVDPERDTVEVLSQYVPAFHPRLVGLTGSIAQVKAAAKSFKVYFAKTESETAPDGYFMAHSGYVYLMSPDGTFDSIFTEKRDSPEHIARELLKRIDSRND